MNNQLITIKKYDFISYLMNKTLLITLTLTLLVSTLLGQKRVVLQSNGSTTIFGGSNAFLEAYNEAVNGDTLYLPGLQFSVPSPFDKSLVIFLMISFEKRIRLKLRE